MNDQEYQQLSKQVEQGKSLSVVDQFLHDQERQRRQDKPNILQRQVAARQENPLLHSRIPHASADTPCTARTTVAPWEIRGD